jgi:cold shock CspA family protein
MADRRSRSPQRSDRSRSPPRQQRARSPARGGGRQDGKGEVLKGKAGRWNDKGFCFILPDGAAKGEDIFCHFSAITDGNCLSEGDPVEFEKSWDDNKQKYRAANVTGGHTEDRRAPSGGGFGGGRGGGGSGPCYSFRDGKCTRGSSCRFSHESGGINYFSDC